MRYILLNPLLRSAIVLTMSATAFAQVQGSLVGTIRDSAGAVIPGATATATHRDQGLSWSSTSNGAGAYVFENLPVGSYSLEFSAPFFRTLRVEGIELHVASILRQDASLSVAGATFTVEVESSTPLVQTETPETGQIVESDQITELPLNGRNVLSLLRLAGGAETGISPAARYTSLSRPSLAGGRAGYTVFRIEGIDINSQNLPGASVIPGVDAVEEFRAVTQLAPASESSSSTVNFAIKSGTNEFHGAAYEFLRNNVLDAHPFFERQVTSPSFHTTPDQLRYNLFGGAIGGPVKKNRTFFFANLEFTRERTQSQFTGIYPTAQMLTGDFSGVDPLSGSALANFAPVNDPRTQQPFPGNRIPSERFSPFASSFVPIAFVPANCLACQAQGLGFNFVGEQPGFNNVANYLGRIDHRISDRDTLFGNLQIAPGSTVSVGSPISISVLDLLTRSYFFSANEIHTFNASTVNAFRAGYTSSSSTQQQEQDAKGAFTFQNTPISLPSLYPTVALAGYTGLFGNGGVSDRNFGRDDSLDISDSLTHVRGNHNFKAGLDVMRDHFWNTLNVNAIFVYANSLPSSLGFTGSAFADLLLGAPLEGVTFQGTGKAQMVERSVTAGYIEDDWKATRRLTIDVGLRYEFPQRWHDSNTSLNRLGTLDLSPASQALGGRFLLGGSPNYYVPGVGVIQGSGAPLIRGALGDPQWRDFQPRAGLAFRPFNDNQTALRAGFGVYYSLQDANSLAFEELSPPFEFSSTVLNLPPVVPVGHPLQEGQFFPAVPPSGVATEGADPHNRDPHMYQWSFSIEHQIGRGLLFSAEYLGNHGIDQPITVLPNQPSLPNAQQLSQLERTPALNGTLALARAPFPNASLPYQYIQNTAQSWYQALNLRAEGRFRRKLNFSAVYTWSKALDMASAEQQLPGVSSNTALGKSYSDYDHPQRFVGSWVYALPFGFEVTGIATFEAGSPYSVLMGVDTSFTGSAAPSFPDLIGAPVRLNVRQSNGIYLTPQNFVAPPFGQFGTLARNALHGPGVNNFDLGVVKSITLKDNLHAQLRGELFNAFNHAQFALAGSTLASSIAAPPAGASLPVITYMDPSQFGRVTARPPRIVQFAAKLIW